MMATITLQAAYDQARHLLEANDTERAIAVAQHVLEFFPDNLEARRILGEAYLAGRQFDLAQAAFQRVLSSEPESIPAHFGLALTYERQNRLDLAVAEFERALEIKPDMAELRSQLLRLYADAWGSDGAQLRLSRVGLARLYAKGHMLLQAIQEFRNVIKESGERLDARIGLAESLWIDGQDEAAAAECQNIITYYNKRTQHQADVLKANLLLGYIQLAAGNSEGEIFWQTAQDMDPYQQIAHAMFDVLPDVAAPKTELPEWDEAAWHQQQEAMAARAAAATAAATPPPPAEPEPVEEDMFAESLLGDSSFLEEAEPSPAQEAPAAQSSADDNDFLASLLGFGAPTIEEQRPTAEEPSDADMADLSATPFSFDEVVEEDTQDIQPFSFDEATADETGTPADYAAQSQEQPADAASTDEDELTPLALEDLGLSPDEIAAIESVEPAADASPPHAESEPDSFDFEAFDFDVTEEPAAAPAETEEQSGEAETGAEEELAPFSFEDLGLSPDEIAALESAEQAVEELPPQTTSEPDIDSFDFEAFDFDATEEPAAAPIETEAAEPPTGAEPGAEEELAPFSLADLGLSPDEIAALESVEPAADASPPHAESEPDSFDFEAFDFDITEEPAAAPTETEAAEPPTGAEPGAEEELAPFSLADLGLSPDEIAALESVETTMPEAEPESAPQAQEPEPFSFEDMNLDFDSDMGPSGPSPEAASTDISGVSDEESLDVEPFNWSSDMFGTPETAESPAPQGQEPFGGFEMGSPGEESGDLQPFTFDDLDISAALTPDDDADELPPSLLPFSLDEGMGNMSDMPAESPFGNIGGVEMPSAPAPGSAEDEDEGTGEQSAYSWQMPSSREGTGFLREEAEESSEREGESSIFLKLKQRRQEMVVEEPPPLPETPLSEHDDFGFFSEDDVSLRDEELEAVQGISDSETPTEEPLVTLDGLQQGTPGAEPEPTELEPEPAVFEPEPAVPEPEPVAPEPEPAPEPASTEAEEPELAPFSLTDLGLSPEEIAALEGMQQGEGEAPAEVAPEPAVPEPEPVAPEPEPAPEPASTEAEEPELTPFSLTDLGLSPEEIAALEGMQQGEGEAPAEAAPEPAVPEPEPVVPEPEPEPVAPDTSDDTELTPFSLTDLGLSPEEIAALEGMQQGGAPAETEEAGVSEEGESEEFEPFAASEESEAAPETVSLEMNQKEPFTETGSLAGFDEDLLPFSLDDLELGLNTEVLPSDELGGLDENRLNLTDEDLAGIDFGEPSFEGVGKGGIAASGDRALDNLLQLGQRQGFVELVDIINVVDDPEEESDRIEQIAWALHRAGIQIRDEGEVIDLEAEDEMPSEEVEQMGGDVSAEEPRPTRRLSPDELEQGDVEGVPPSLADLGLTDEEIAQLGLGEGQAAPASIEEGEPEIAPLSLADLGLTDEEIAQLGLLSSQQEGAEETPSAQEEQPSAEAMPFEDLGLTDEQLAKLGGMASISTPSSETGSSAAPTAPREEEAGLDDAFDFSVADEKKEELTPARRTAPREEEKAAEPTPEDLAFEPEPLDALDDIWDAPDTEAPEEPARVVLPPRSSAPAAAPARPRAAAATRRDMPPRDRGAAARTPARDPRRSDPRRSGGSAGPQRGDPRRSDPRREAPQRPARRAEPARRPPQREPVAAHHAEASSFYPTGDAALDEFLQQIEAEPDNFGLRLAVARMAMQSEHKDLAFHEYKQALQDSDQVEQIVDDVTDLIESEQDPAMLKRLHRLLGDCYSRQKRFHDAMAEYKWTFSG
jgi:tetratricopeptide (TPR) repeat protein/uncharacterized protein YjiS (DUF1127 family)